jgi:hypothetical protein
MATEEHHWLQDVWSFYFHDPEDADWTLDSYKRLGDAATVEDAWQVHGAIAPHAACGMFFVMREHVFPCWDDKHNIDGGCLSIKIPADAAQAAWELLVKRALGETLVVDDGAWAKLNGVSISPKRGFCIAKLWIADETLKDRSAFRLPEDYRGEVVYRSNRDNMQTFSTHQHQHSPKQQQRPPTTEDVK